MKRFFLITAIVLSAFLTMFIFIGVGSSVGPKLSVCYECNISIEKLIDRLEQIKAENPDLCVNMTNSNGELLYRDRTGRSSSMGSDDDRPDNLMHLYFKVYDGQDSLILFTTIYFFNDLKKTPSEILLKSIYYVDYYEDKNEQWIIGPGISWCRTAEVCDLFEKEVLDKLGVKYEKNRFTIYLNDLCLRSQAMIHKIL